jgi:hypothetical protein
MARTCLLLFLLALAGCAGLPPPRPSDSPCAVSEASYACQVKRYHDTDD